MNLSLFVVLISALLSDCLTWVMERCRSGCAISGARVGWVLEEAADSYLIYLSQVLDRFWVGGCKDGGPFSPLLFAKPGGD